ncbi:vWA domain-containing protein, partial [Aquipuribacter hungaricus]
ARRRREVSRRGDADGALTRAQAQLDQALALERDALAGRQDDDARFDETRLASLPRSTSRAVQELADYAWSSPEAQELYQGILDGLQQEVLDHQFDGISDALRQMAEGGGQESSEALQKMLGDLDDLLEAHARGEDTTEQFEQFMAEHGDLVPGEPKDTDELVDALARRSAEAQRLLQSMSPQQRAELAALTEAALGRDPGLAEAMARLSQRLREARPEAFQRGPGRGGLSGEEPLGYGEAASALGELADLDDLLDSLGQEHPGATLDDVDVEQVERALGRSAAQEVAALKELERQLREQGWVTGPAEEARLSPKAMRRLGQSALRAIAQRLTGRGRGEHDDPRAGSSGEPTGAWREWRFGDEQPLDVVRTVQNAVLRSAQQPGGRSGGAVRLAVEDMAVVETEDRSRAAVALCVDLSFSMVSEGRWAPMKRTALALQHLVSSRYAHDSLQVIGFDRHARPMTTTELAHVEPEYVQGTNLAHALALAREHVSRHPDATPVVLVVTDGEPTAHNETWTMPDGSVEVEAVFDWPPRPETVQATVREVDALTRMRVPIDVVMLGEDPGLVRFVDAIARRNGGRVLSADPDRLGGAVVADYLRARRG